MQSSGARLLPSHCSRLGSGLALPKQDTTPFGLTSTNICFYPRRGRAQRSPPRWDVKIDEKDNASAPPIQAGKRRGVFRAGVWYPDMSKKAFRPLRIRFIPSHIQLVARKWNSRALCRYPRKAGERFSGCEPRREPAGGIPAVLGGCPLCPQMSNTRCCPPRWKPWKARPRTPHGRR